MTSSGRTGWTAAQWALLFTLSGNMVLDSIEVSVVLIALPSIGADLDLSLWTVQWLMSGFALGFAALLLLGTRINARFGRRRAYLSAMVVFAAASAIGGLADEGWLLIATRIVKGGCAALTAPAGLAIIATTFAGPRQRTAVSIYSLFGAAGFTAGLLLSGALLESGWRWTFLFPVPVALLLVLFGLRVLPHDPARHVAPPLLPASLRDASLLRSALGAAALNGTYQSLLVLITFQLRLLLQWTPWQTALALLPACVPLALTVPFAGRVVARFGTDRLIALGAVAALLGELLYLWRPDPATYPSSVLPALLLVEAGFVLSFAALNMQATRTIPDADRAQAVSLYQTGVQFGSVLLLPLVALLLTGFDGVRPALSLIAAAGAAGVLVAVTGGIHRFAGPSMSREVSP